MNGLNRARGDRIVDVASVALISLAAVLTAFCTYRSGTWSGEESKLYNSADAYRIKGAEAAGRSNALTAIDVDIFLRYVAAVETHDRRLQLFLDARSRPEMRSALKAWLATKPLKNPKAPSSPFVMPGYRLSMTAQAARYDNLAAQDFRAAVEAHARADRYLLLTVIFASVSFLAGISTKMTFPRHVLVVSLGSAALLYGIIRLTHFKLF